MIRSLIMILLYCCLNSLGGWLLGFPKANPVNIMFAMLSFNVAGILMWIAWGKNNG